MALASEKDSTGWRGGRWNHGRMRKRKVDCIPRIDAWPPAPGTTRRPPGGRTRTSHRAVLKAIWFALVTGCRWADVPTEVGCSSRTIHRRLRHWDDLDVWDRLHANLLRLLRQADKFDPDVAVIDAVYVRAFRGGG